MKITFSDHVGMVEVDVHESGITCDGSYMFFSDTEGRDYRVTVSDVFSIVEA